MRTISCLPKIRTPNIWNDPPPDRYFTRVSRCLKILEQERTETLGRFRSFFYICVIE